MPANSEPLQGSLFEDLEAAENTIDDMTIVNRDFCQEISDQELVEDAKQRPRQRMDEKPETETTFSPKKNGQGIDPEDSLPKWSHHSLQPLLLRGSLVFLGLLLVFLLLRFLLVR